MKRRSLIWHCPSDELYSQSSKPDLALSLCRILLPQNSAGGQQRAAAEQGGGGPPVHPGRHPQHQAGGSEAGRMGRAGRVSGAVDLWAQVDQEGSAAAAAGGCGEEFGERDPHQRVR